MKMKHIRVLVAVVVASLGANAAHAIQKHDPIFQTRLAKVSQKEDPDLVLQQRNQYGSPHSKMDLYVVHAAKHGVDRDLAREIRYQNGTPKSKVDPSVQSFELAPLK